LPLRTGPKSSTREGEVNEGDAIERIGRDPDPVTISEITRLYVAKRYSKGDVESARRVLNAAALPDSWKEFFTDRLESMDA
jgi:MOSC domain-containing protein YiiM